MPMNYNIFVPAKYTLENYFLPKIKNPTLEHFEVDRKRHGIQRKGNNHLVVFLDFRGKKSSVDFAELGGGDQGEIFMKNQEELTLFRKVFKDHKEVAVFSLSFNSRMSVFVWKVLIELVDEELILVEDESGKIMSGPDCARSLRSLMGQGSS